MEQELIISHEAPAINANFDEVAAALDTELERYTSLVVTPDNIQDAKKAAAELNKYAGTIDAKRKETVSEVSAPIKAFESQMKDLRERCKTARQGIVDQVAQYEDQVKAQANQLLNSRRTDLWSQHEVRIDYQRTTIDDLVKLGSVTGKGNLAKAARETLESRVKDDRALQDTVDRRMLELERDSYKAGLDAPLTWENVAHFIEDEAETYRERLAAVMSAEIKREEKAEAHRREKAEREAKVAAEAQAQSDSRDAAQRAEADVAASAERAAQADTPAPEVVNGDHAWRMTVVFDISTPADKNISPEKLKTHVSNRLKDAGIPEPSYMEAHRVES
ncbi:DUF1351 domain-containing protein [Salinisphaera sp. SPP-AMP-43]|uniref:DUF1351 domain-containing protein n=1 Tax=Salinisphaera sp. SPP-AMP-43 TaxID=3121288 RepID=UPI003C6E1BEF